MSDNPYDVRWHKVKERATSRVNMTWLVVLELFTFPELRDHNVRGIGKDALDKAKMEATKKIVTTYFPFNPEENGHVAWLSCEKNVDTYLRKVPYNCNPKIKIVNSTNTIV